MTRRHILPAILATALLTSGCDRNVHPRQLGTPAPTFSISDGHQTIDLAQLRGHVVVLNFWAAWCITCLEELPSLEQLHHTDPDVRLIAVSIDPDPDLYQQFLTRHHVDFPTVLNGPDGVAQQYKTFNPPETYILDKQGIIRRKFIGPQDWTSPEITNFLHKLATS